MRFWWVNQKKTHRQEIGGRYMWSPKTRSDGARNEFYLNMRRVDAGDIVFSFYKQCVQHMGIVTRPAVGWRKPPEFGKVGEKWDQEGWLVSVIWHEVPAPLSPKSIIEELRPTLPEKYAPLKSDGNGKELYLAAVPQAMADVLLEHLGSWADEVVQIARHQPALDGPLEELEAAEEREIENDDALSDTEKMQLQNARLGQGKFRSNLESVEHACRVTGVSDHRLLIASHIKPWRSCRTKRERLDGHNGLLLSPHVDHLFDKGYITFSDDGDMRTARELPPEQLSLMGLPEPAEVNVGAFSEQQKAYLAYHRKHIFKEDV
jgi:putative restriction endonuclease